MSWEALTLFLLRGTAVAQQVILHNSLIFLNLILASNLRCSWSLQSGFGNHRDDRGRGFFFSLFSLFDFDIIILALIYFFLQIGLPNWDVGEIKILIIIEIWNFNDLKGFLVQSDLFL